jgi:hypothetical protein
MSTVDVAPALPRRLSGVTILVYAQLILAATYYLGVGGLYVYVSARTGWQGWLGPDNDPKDYWPSIVGLLYVPVAFAGWVGFVFAFPLSIAGGVVLALPRVRARRGTWLALLAGTVLCVGMVAVMFTPLGQHVQAWMLD